MTFGIYPVGRDRSHSSEPELAKIFSEGIGRHPLRETTPSLALEPNHRRAVNPGKKENRNAPDLRELVEDAGELEPAVRWSNWFEIVSKMA